MKKRYGMILTAVSFIIICCPAYAEDKNEDGEVRYDYVTDTAKSIVNKASALLTGKLDIKVEPENRASPDDYTRDALGRKVPKSTAVRSAGSLHSDQPL